MATAFAKGLATGLLGLAVAAVSAAAQPPPATPVSAAPPPTPPEFAACVMCHATAPGAAPMVGPNLWGVGGRKAGSADYPYSPAMKGLATVWTADTLAAFIARPTEVAPGTIMDFPGEPNAGVAKALAVYLMTLKD